VQILKASAILNEALELLLIHFCIKGNNSNGRNVAYKLIQKSRIAPFVCVGVRFSINVKIEST